MAEIRMGPQDGIFSYPTPGVKNSGDTISGPFPGTGF